MILAEDVGNRSAFRLRGQSNGVHPGWRWLPADVFLEEALGRDVVGMSVEGLGPVFEIGQQDRSHFSVISDQVPLRVSLFRPVTLVQIRQDRWRKSDYAVPRSGLPRS